jgi:hypothetical protein
MVEAASDETAGRIAERLADAVRSLAVQPKVT